MGIVFRQSIKSSLVIFFGAFLGAVSNLIYPYVLSQTQLGFFTNIIYWSALLQVFMLLGTGSVLAVFIQKYPEDDEKRKVLITIGMLATFLTTVMFSVGYLFCKEYIISQYQPADQTLVREYFYWTPLLLLLMSLGTLFEMYLLSQTKTAISAFSKEVLVRLVNLALIGLLATGALSFKAFIITNIFVYLLPAIMLMYVSSTTSGFGISTNWKVFSRTEYAEILRFAWYHLLLGVSLNIMGYLDTLMLATLDTRGMETVAPYRIAVFIISVAIIPYRAMSTSSISTLNKAYIDNDIPHLRNLFQRAGSNILLVTAGVFLLIVCNLDNIVKILPAGYDVVKPIVLILALGRLLDIATGVNSELINLSKYYKFNFKVSALLIILLYSFNRLLIPSWGIHGAAWSATITLVLFNLAKTFFLWRTMNLHPFTRNNILILLIALCVGVVGYILPVFVNVGSAITTACVDLLIRSSIIGGLYFLLLMWVKPSEDLKTYLASVKRDRRLF
ncbi:polysaccharide biosynthesis C-terminal domain-containing protein [Polluticoccus soli]|uniref:oligosaccharide flippase family protein n=1 Tax=Polluticoccus soli TaxID=3034150 RepID=UPI0023E16C7E|nr:polysaccharide biosynthesis C-terminal domain-containing protein [Flavipsychrobacter sp. JY13-12]